MRVLPTFSAAGCSTAKHGDKSSRANARGRRHRRPPSAARTFQDPPSLPYETSYGRRTRRTYRRSRWRLASPHRSSTRVENHRPTLDLGPLTHRAKTGQEKLARRASQPPIGRLPREGRRGKTSAISYEHMLNSVSTQRRGLGSVSTRWQHWQNPCLRQHFFITPHKHIPGGGSEQ